VLRRGADHISRYAGAPPYDIDVAGLLNWARSLAEQLDDPTNDVGPTTPNLCQT
jgi:hypothetical protein